MTRTSDWEISGAESQTIHGTMYVPREAPVGCAIVAHGFKGYKDFRMIPAISRELCNARLIVHAFNFSHSGMTANPETFERPDLFELDTWNKQVIDLQRIVAAIARGQLAGTELPYVLVGHSRGGVSSILYAARCFTKQLDDEVELPRPAGVVTVGTPDRACGLSDGDQQQLHQQGYLNSPSARTGQTLRVGLRWLTEQETDPVAHDVLRCVSVMECPMLIVHGEDDETIDVACSESIAKAAKQPRLVKISSCNHVLNAPNPAPLDISQIPALCHATKEIVDFAGACCANHDPTK